MIKITTHDTKKKQVPQSARLFHTSTNVAAKAVAMSRFDPNHNVPYEKMRKNINIVKDRLVLV